MSHCYNDTVKMPVYKTLLASASPRRRELLRLLAIPYEVCSTDIDEIPLPGESSSDMVARLSRAKALAAHASNPNALIIACDTTVDLNRRNYGKPVDPDDARRMLRELRGREHSVYGGISVAYPSADGRSAEEAIETIVVRTRVWMRNYSDAEIEAYVASGDPMDKAASYAVQHPLFRPVERIEGCFANVMGLSLCRLYPLLARHQLMPEPRIDCILHPEENCTVAHLVAQDKITAT